MSGLDSVISHRSCRCRSFVRSIIAPASFRAIAGVTSLLFATGAMAADDAKIIFPSGTPAAGAPTVASTSTLNMITVLVALLLAAVAAWLFKRNRRSPAAGRDLRLLAIDETRSLGNRQYLVVASYEDKKFLLGVCPGRIDLLSSLHEESGAEDKP
jgi:flagellar protein FliO/FliZ